MDSAEGWRENPAWTGAPGPVSGEPFTSEVSETSASEAAGPVALGVSGELAPAEFTEQLTTLLGDPCCSLSESGQRIRDLLDSHNPEIWASLTTFASDHSEHLALISEHGWEGLRDDMKDRMKTELLGTSRTSLEDFRTQFVSALDAVCDATLRARGAEGLGDDEGSIKARHGAFGTPGWKSDIDSVFTGEGLSEFDQIAVKLVFEAACFQITKETSGRGRTPAQAIDTQKYIAQAGITLRTGEKLRTPAGKQEFWRLEKMMALTERYESFFETEAGVVFDSDGWNSYRDQQMDVLLATNQHLPDGARAELAGDLADLLNRVERFEEDKFAAVHQQMVRDFSSLLTNEDLIPGLDAFQLSELVRLGVPGHDGNAYSVETLAQLRLALPGIIDDVRLHPNTATFLAGKIAERDHSAAEQSFLAAARSQVTRLSAALDRAKQELADHEASEVQYANGPPEFRPPNTDSRHDELVGAEAELAAHRLCWIPEVTRTQSGYLVTCERHLGQKEQRQAETTLAQHEAIKNRRFSVQPGSPSAISTSSFPSGSAISDDTTLSEARPPSPFEYACNSQEARQMGALHRHEKLQHIRAKSGKVSLEQYQKVVVSVSKYDFRSIVEGANPLLRHIETTPQGRDAMRLLRNKRLLADADRLGAITRDLERCKRGTRLNEVTGRDLMNTAASSYRDGLDPQYFDTVSGEPISDAVFGELTDLFSDLNACCDSVMALHRPPAGELYAHGGKVTKMQELGILKAQLTKAMLERLSPEARSEIGTHGFDEFLTLPTVETILKARCGFDTYDEVDGVQQLNEVGKMIQSQTATTLRLHGLSSKENLDQYLADIELFGDRVSALAETTGIAYETRPIQ